MVEYQQPTAMGPTGGEVIVGTVVLAAGVLFGLSALLIVVAIFVMPGYRENVGVGAGVVVALVLGAIAMFCGRFGMELFRGRRPRQDY